MTNEVTKPVDKIEELVQLREELTEYLHCVLEIAKGKSLTKEEFIDPLKKSKNRFKIVR